LLAFSTLHDQIRKRREEEAKRYTSVLGEKWDDGWDFEQFVLDEVLQLVAERARAVTGANGVAIALAEGNEIVCRASVGPMTPDRDMRLDPNSGFSGACFRTGKIIRCDDSETDPRVNVQACRRLGTRSMVAVPLRGQESVVGLLEAFSTEPYGFNDADVRSLKLLAELILAALKPEEENRIVQAAKAATTVSDIAHLEHLWHLPSDLGPLAAPPTVRESAQPDIPLELSTENIAPNLYEGRAGSRRRALAIAFVAIAALGLTAGIWWRVHHSAPRGDMAVSSEPSSSSSARAEGPSAVTPIESNENAPVRTNTAPVQVTGIHHLSEPGSTTVSIDLEQAVQYESHRLPMPKRIYFDLRDTVLAPGFSLKPIDVNDGVLNRIRIAQPDTRTTRVVLEIKTGATFTVRLEQNPYRLVVEVRGPGTGIAPPKTDAEPPAVSEKTRVTAMPATPPSREDLALRARVPKLRIVLDAGHGGWDLGTVGRKGLLEKDLVLEVAQRLGNLLEDRLGSEVIFTRRGDSYIPLEQRAETANRAQADLFVSVHANYSELESARGVETYYSNFFVTPEAREVEPGGNSAAGPETRTHLTSVELKDKVDGSRKLAASVQHALYAALARQNPGIRNRGVREASFVVLTGTEMPSILAEISFVSSPTDEEKLQSAAYRQDIANALYMGIERYAAASNRLKLATTSARAGGK
jgi:N-acetylmuramoyl-L-alanine amidase/putative methionine-R-sulfoxide reductase with GAF domain